MLKIGSWLDYVRVKSALRGYPPYCPPHPAFGGELKRKQALENFEFFLAEKERRIDYLRIFFAKFGIKLEFTQDSLRKVNDWLYRFSGLLFNERVAHSVYYRYTPVWEKEFSGFNIPHDVAIYAGSYVIGLNRDAKWVLFTNQDRRGTRNSPGYHEPYLGGIPLIDGGTLFNIKEFMLVGCVSANQRLRFVPPLPGDTWRDPDNFIKCIDDAATYIQIY